MKEKLVGGAAYITCGIHVVLALQHGHQTQVPVVLAFTPAVYDTLRSGIVIAHDDGGGRVDVGVRLLAAEDLATNRPICYGMYLVSQHMLPQHPQPRCYFCWLRWLIFETSVLVGTRVGLLMAIARVAEPA